MMVGVKFHRPIALLAGALAIFAAVAPIDFGVDGLALGDHLWSRMVFGILGVTALRDSQDTPQPANAIWNLPFAALLAAVEIVDLAHMSGVRGWGFFCAIGGVWLAAWRTVDILSLIHI